MRRNFSSLFHHLQGNEPFFLSWFNISFIGITCADTFKLGCCLQKIKPIYHLFPRKFCFHLCHEDHISGRNFGNIRFFSHLKHKKWRDSILISTFHKKMKKLMKIKKEIENFLIEQILKKRFFIKEMQFVYSPFYPSSFIWDLRFSHLNSLFSLHHISASYNCIK